MKTQKMSPFLSFCRYIFNKLCKLTKTSAALLFYVIISFSIPMYFGYSMSQIAKNAEILKPFENDEIVNRVLELNLFDKTRFNYKSCQDKPEIHSLNSSIVCKTRFKKNDKFFN